MRIGVAHNQRGRLRVVFNEEKPGMPGFLYTATEIVASGFGAGEAGAQRPEHTQQYVRSASTARPRPRVAQ